MHSRHPHVEVWHFLNHGPGPSLCPRQEGGGADCVMPRPQYGLESLGDAVDTCSCIGRAGPASLACSWRNIRTRRPITVQEGPNAGPIPPTIIIQDIKYPPPQQSGSMCIAIMAGLVRGKVLSFNFSQKYCVSNNKYFQVRNSAYRWCSRTFPEFSTFVYTMSTGKTHMKKCFFCGRTTKVWLPPPPNLVVQNNFFLQIFYRLEMV